MCADLMSIVMERCHICDGFLASSCLNKGLNLSDEHYCNIDYTFTNFHIFSFDSDCRISTLSKFENGVIFQFSERLQNMYLDP